MVQVDVFWAYGMGSGFALAAARQLRTDKRDREGLLTNRYFTGTLLYLALLFAPSGVWLLWAYPMRSTCARYSARVPAAVGASRATTARSRSTVWSRTCTRMSRLLAKYR